MQNLKPNPGRKLKVSLDSDGGKGEYLRIPIKTKLVVKEDDIFKIVKDYAAANLKKGDILFMSEKVVAITQGRAFPIDEIKPSKLANFLVKFVEKSPYGIGLGSPWTMELALREVSAFRLILGIIGAAITKPFGIKGVFYHICGYRASAIDGPGSYNIEPYNRYVILGPLNPDKVASDIKKVIGNEVVIVDSNDFGLKVLGKSNKNISDKFCEKVFQGNPIGQSKEQTPLCIVRKINH